jgi:SAM-dependent methyltransferase
VAHLARVLDRLNASHPWSHNEAYSPWVLRHARLAVRAGARTGLDVGCGTGLLLGRLARVLPEVTGLEADPATARRAAEAVRHLEHARVVDDTFPSRAVAPADVVSMVAVLHHLPLCEGVSAARDSVAPGGRLLVVGCYLDYLDTTPTGVALALLSSALNPLVGLVLHPRRARGHPEHMTAPVAPATSSWAEVRDVLRAELPGVRLRRGLFWRYVAVWVAPPGRTRPGRLTPW